MSRLLSELLAAEEPKFGMAIRQFEAVSGNASIDVRLTAEIVGKVHMRLKALGLDPHDTTGRELYASLIGLAARHDDFLARRIGILDPHDVQAVLLRVADAARALDVPKDAWVLKISAAKRLLKQSPPKKVMKQLGYRSIDSMIKRESTTEIYGAIRFLETEDWQRKFIAKYATLKPADFEIRRIDIVHMNPDKWGSSAIEYVNRTRHNVTHLKELGAVLILPLPIVRMPGITLITLPLVLHYINEIRMYASYFKSCQVRADFGLVIVTTLTADPDQHARVAGQDIHWRVIHRHFGGSQEFSDILEPHVVAEDLIWRKTEETLYKLEPALHFWFDIEYVAVIFDDRPVSFNLMDIATNYANSAPYGSQSVHYMRASLWNEIYLRYIKEQAVESDVIKQIEQNNELGHHAPVARGKKK